MGFRTLGISTIVAMALVVSALAGCSQLPYQTAANISSHSNSVQAKTREVAGRVDKTMTALATLINKPAGSLGSGFKNFSDQLGALKNGYASLKNAINNVTGNQANYMAIWEKQIQSIGDSDIQAAAKSNYAAAQRDFSHFTKRSMATEASGGKFMAYLNNMKKYLSTDLSSSGLKGASHLLGNAKSRSKTFLHDLGKLGNDAARLSKDLNPVAGSAK